MKTKTLSALLVLAGLGPASGWAQPSGGPLLDWAVGYRIEYQDNIAQLPDGEIDDFISAPYLELGLDRAGTVLDARINGYLEHASYLDDTFDDQFRASLASSFVWRLSDERFHWVLEDSMAESSIDPRAFRNPANQQFTNSLSTGPDLILRPSGADRITIGARYHDFYAEETDDDYDGWLASAAWSRRLAAGRAFGFRVKTATVEFGSGSPNTDYDRHDAAFEYRQQRSQGAARDQLSLNLGYSVVEFDQPGRDDRDTPAIRLSWERSEEGGRRFRVSLAQEIGDIAGDLNAVVDAQRPDVIFPTAVTGDPFTRRGVQFEWAQAWQRVSLEASGFYDDLNYDSDALDQDFLGLRVGLGYRLRPLLALQASVDWSDREFTAIDQDDETVGLALGLEYQRTRHWVYSLSAGWSDRASSNPAFDADNASVTAQVVYRR